MKLLLPREGGGGERGKNPLDTSDGKNEKLQHDKIRKPAACYWRENSSRSTMIVRERRAGGGGKLRNLPREGDCGDAPRREKKTKEGRADHPIAATKRRRTKTALHAAHTGRMRVQLGERSQTEARSRRGKDAPKEKPKSRAHGKETKKESARQKKKQKKGGASLKEALIVNRRRTGRIGFGSNPRHWGLFKRGGDEEKRDSSLHNTRGVRKNLKKSKTIRKKKKNYELGKKMLDGEKRGGDREERSTVFLAVRRRA